MKKLLSLVAVAALFASCANAPATTPDNCIFNPERQAKVHVEFEGKQVGFCCNKCAGKFAKMDANAKAAAVAKAAK